MGSSGAVLYRQFVEVPCASCRGGDEAFSSVCGSSIHLLVPRGVVKNITELERLAKNG
jgi:hypothetical protein